MFVTKLGHSCVLVETEDRIGLFDPGGWSDRSLIDAVEHVDRIVYTHAHPDHFVPEILESLLARFPQAHVICGQDVAAAIESAGISATVREWSQCTVSFHSPHETVPIPNVPAIPQNGYHFKDSYTHPGDSHSFGETKKILAMPFVAPWGSVTDGVNKVLELKPEYVLPVHDWLYNDQSRAWLSDLIGPVLKQHGVTLLSAEIGVRHEL